MKNPGVNRGFVFKKKLRSATRGADTACVPDVEELNDVIAVDAAGGVNVRARRRGIPVTEEENHVVSVDAAIVVVIGDAVVCLPGALGRRGRVDRHDYRIGACRTVVVRRRERHRVDANAERNTCGAC